MNLVWALFVLCFNAVLVGSSKQVSYKHCILHLLFQLSVKLTLHFYLYCICLVSISVCLFLSCMYSVLLIIVDSLIGVPLKENIIIIIYRLWNCLCY